MQVSVITFGQLKEITGHDPVYLQNVHDTDEVKKRITELFPRLSEFIYVMAVDKNIVTEKIKLEDNATIALLPPFSGG